MSKEGLKQLFVDLEQVFALIEPSRQELKQIDAVAKQVLVCIILPFLNQEANSAVI